MQQSAEVLSKEAADIQALRIQNMILQVNPYPILPCCALHKFPRAAMSMALLHSRPLWWAKCRCIHQNQLGAAVVVKSRRDARPGPGPGP